ncbi:Cytochrome P450 4C1, partial [Orchesella cincta]
LISILIWKKLTQRNPWNRYYSLPGPGQHVFGVFSNMLAFRDLTKAIKVGDKWCAKYGPVYNVNFGFWSGTCLNSPEYVQKLFSPADAENDKGRLYDNMRPFLKDGLLLSKGDKWRFRRKLLTKHMFSFKTLMSYMSIFNEEADSFVKEIGEVFSDGKEKEVEHIVMTSSLNVITKAALGKSVAALESKEPGDVSFHECVNRSKEITGFRAGSPWLILDFLWRLHPKFKEQDFIAKMITKHTMKALVDDENEGKQTLGIKKDMYLIGKLILKGYETTGSSLHFLLFFLALNPQIQEKCREEIDSIFDDESLAPSGNLLYAALSKLKYLEMCVHETTRLLPVAFFNMRRLAAPLKLEEDLIIPQGTHVGIFLPGIHKNPKYFPEPEQFLPERWLDEEVNRRRHPNCFIPFSGGPRKCIGQKFGMMEMLTLTAKLLRHFKIETRDKLEDVIFLPHVTLTPQKPMKFVFKSRHQ